jgi:hypothetical protein
MNERHAVFVIAATLTVLFIGGLIVAHESSAEFRSYISDIAGHHWVSLSILSAAIILLLCIAIYFLTYIQGIRQFLRANDLWRWAVYLTITTTIMIMGSFAVYFYHYLIV